MKSERQVFEGLEVLRKMRSERKEVEMLVETAEAWKPARKKEKITREEPSKRLELWMKDWLSEPFPMHYG